MFVVEVTNNEVLEILQRSFRGFPVVANYESIEPFARTQFFKLKARKGPGDNV